jgi:hypothetical protein
MNNGAQIMENQRQIAPVQEPFRVRLQRCLINGAKQRLRLIGTGLSRSRDEAQTAALARKILDYAWQWTYSEETARRAVEYHRDEIEVVLPPTHLKRFQSIIAIS